MKLLITLIAVSALLFLNSCGAKPGTHQLYDEIVPDNLWTVNDAKRINQEDLWSRKQF